MFKCSIFFSGAISIVLAALPVSSQVIEVLPYIQILSSTVGAVNATGQIVDRFKPRK